MDDTNHVLGNWQAGLPTSEGFNFRMYSAHASSDGY